MYITEELLLFKIIGQFSKQLNLVLFLPQNCAFIYMLICSFCLPEIPSNINSRMMRPTHTFVSIHGKQSKPNISNVFFSFLRWITTPYFNILDLYQIHWLDLDSGHFGEKNCFFYDLHCKKMQSKCPSMHCFDRICKGSCKPRVLPIM